MMSTTNKREKWLLFFFPSVLVIAGYSWIFLKQQNKEIRELQKKITEAEKKSPSPQKLFEITIERDALKKQIQTQTQQIKTIQEEMNLLQKKWNPKNGMATLTRLTELFKEHQLLLLSETVFENSGNAEKPESLRYYEKRMLEQNQPQKIYLWKFELFGPFEQVQQVLWAIHEQELNIFPISLSMKQTQGNGGHLWQLTLWL